jgi:hypothetical protein
MSMNESNPRTTTVEQDALTIVDDTYGHALGPWCAPVEFEDVI